MKTNKKYSVSELSEAVEVTKRTIHYYVQKDLIPSPEGRGVHSKYTDEHFYRIMLIKKYQEMYYPLNKIREIIQYLSLDEVKEKLADHIPSGELRPGRRSRFIMGFDGSDIKAKIQDDGPKYRMQSLNKHDVVDFLKCIADKTSSKPVSEEVIRVKFDKRIELQYPQELHNSNLIRKLVKTIPEIIEDNPG